MQATETKSVKGVRRTDARPSTTSLSSWKNWLTAVCLCGSEIFRVSEGTTSGVPQSPADTSTTSRIQFPQAKKGIYLQHA